VIEVDVVAELRVAFKDVPASAWVLGVQETHEDLVEYWDELPYLEPDAVHWLLPRILIDIVERHRAGTLGVWEAERVLEFLAVPSPPAGDPNVIATGGELSSPRLEMALRASRERSLGPITNAQAEAVADWLDLVAGWPHAEMVDSVLEPARKYWRARARQGESS
jgi:hypothetical protein